MKKVTAFLLASILMSGCITMKDKVNYRLLDNINKGLIEEQLSLKEEAQIYETINNGASQINVNLFKW